MPVLQSSYELKAGQKLEAVILSIFLVLQNSKTMLFKPDFPDLQLLYLINCEAGITRERQVVSGVVRNCWRHASQIFAPQSRTGHHLWRQFFPEFP